MKKNLQNKWRLPTVEEFKNVLHPNKGNIPNWEKNSSYWSSSEYDYYVARYFSFGNGRADYDDKYYTNRVRAVRDILPNSPNSSNSTIIGNLEVYNEDLGRMSWYDAMATVNKLNEIKN